MTHLVQDEEKQCTRCGEWWPADLEFFHASTKGKAGLNYQCKACYREWLAASGNRPSAARKPHITDGIAPLLTTAHFMGLAL